MQDLATIASHSSSASLLSTMNECAFCPRWRGGGRHTHTRIAVRGGVVEQLQWEWVRSMVLRADRARRTDMFVGRDHSELALWPVHEKGCARQSHHEGDRCQLRLALLIDRVDEHLAELHYRGVAERGLGVKEVVGEESANGTLS